MQITDIKIRKLFSDGPMKAIVSVTFDNALAVHDVKVIYAHDRTFIVMPSRKNPDTLAGYSRENKLVNFTAENCREGDLVNVRITAAKSFSLDGETAEDK